MKFSRQIEQKVEISIKMFRKSSKCWNFNLNSYEKLKFQSKFLKKLKFQSKSSKSWNFSQKFRKLWNSHENFFSFQSSSTCFSKTSLSLIVNRRFFVQIHQFIKNSQLFSKQNWKFVTSLKSLNSQPQNLRPCSWWLIKFSNCFGFNVFSKNIFMIQKSLFLRQKSKNPLNCCVFEQQTASRNWH